MLLPVAVATVDPVEVEVDAYCRFPPMEGHIEEAATMRSASAFAIEMLFANIVGDCCAAVCRSVLSSGMRSSGIAAGNGEF
jgi:hypothetical protein